MSLLDGGVGSISGLFEKNSFRSFCFLTCKSRATVSDCLVSFVFSSSVPTLEAYIVIKKFHFFQSWLPYVTLMLRL